jgi:myo-inositol-1-phosphate synthase
MPPRLKKLLADEVTGSGRSFNDVAVGHLAASVAVAFEPSGRPGGPTREGGSVLLRMPAELKERLARRAAERRQTVNELIVGTLSERLGLNGKEAMASTNGRQNGRAGSGDKVRVAIVGVGNCANSLLQGVQYYKDANPDDFVPGLMHVDLGGYHIRDIEFVAAFDVVQGKVGADLSDAIWAHPNNTIKFADVAKTGVKVSRGMTHDGIGKYLSEVVEKAPGETDDVVGILKETQTDVVVNYLPVGSEEATKWYVEQVLTAGCAMVNCMPVFIAREPYWQRRFEEAGVPIIGDDIKSQVGATITHRVLTTLFDDRGVRLDKTMQLNVGGNSDFLNMLERDRLESKKISKTNAVTSMLDYDLGEGNVHVGPSDYVPWLTDRKWAYIRMEGKSFGDVPLNVELKLEVWDSPNSAGIVIDAVRLAKLGMNNGIAGALEAPSSYLMKSPPKQIRDDEAREATERFIKQHARPKTKTAAKA